MSKQSPRSDSSVWEEKIVAGRGRSTEQAALSIADKGFQWDQEQEISFQFPFRVYVGGAGSLNSLEMK